ncbi:MAG: hypothetical protein NTU57_02155 [Candidatus Aenigmarchaeota archaeon]|nr:hypothetical protein [Candidatus Aenigmarchaeota archaeon]
MKRGWVFGLVLLLAVAFLLVPGFARAASPDVIILPDEKVLSVNSAVLIKVDPKTTEKPMRITWSVYNTGSIGLGSFPATTDGKGLCYFSNSDGNATCGPSPFFNSGPTEMYINVITPSGATNKTVPLNISNISIELTGVNKVDNTVYMFFYMAQKAWMKYSIYKEDLSIYQTERPLEYDTVNARYAGNITLNPGVYYFTFMVNNSGTYGSTLKRIEIPSGDYLTMQTSKAEYWTGEKVGVTGTSSASSVTGEVRYPDGKKAKDFSVSVASDHTFSYEFVSEGNWPEGEYEIRTLSPLAKTTKFSIVEFFELIPDSISAAVNESDDFSETIQIKNLRQNSTNISVSVSGDLKDSYVDLGKSSLGPLEATTISIDVPNIEADVEGKVTVKSGDGLELAIPVSITMLEPGQVCTGGKSLAIDKETMILSRECIDGDPVYHEIRVSNSGAAGLTSFSYSVEDTGGGDQYLETLDSSGYIDVPVSDLSVAAGDSETVEISITPSGAGKYEGLINIKAGGETASVLVVLNCYANISEDITSLSYALAGKSVSETVRSDIGSDISKAESALTLGNYAQANEYYQKAQAKIDMLESGVAPAMDLTWIIIIIVIAVVAVVFLWFFKFRKTTVVSEDVDDLEKFS